MIFEETKLQGVFLIRPELKLDERGFFARTWCAKEFQEHGLPTTLVQCSVSYNRRKGTLRGIHFQRSPHQEAKLVRCSMGAIYDVIVDLRPGSATFRQWVAVELSAANHLMLFVPEGFGHGFQTLAENTEVFYQMSEFYYPECSQGVRWNDPAFGIEWPAADRIISSQDQQYPSFTA